MDAPPLVTADEVATWQQLALDILKEHPEGLHLVELRHEFDYRLGAWATSRAKSCSWSSVLDMEGKRIDIAPGSALVTIIS
jgi:hypothetical protein